MFVFCVCIMLDKSLKTHNSVLFAKLLLEIKKITANASKGVKRKLSTQHVEVLGPVEEQPE